MLSQLAVTFAGQSIKAGRGLLAPALLSTAVVGSVIGVNFVGRNNTVSLMAVDKAVLTATSAKDTGSGGLAAADTDLTYDTILLPSPYRASAATSNGVRTGTGVVWDAVLSIVANPKGVALDCTKVGPGNKLATGGTLIFNNVSATGSTNVYSTPFVMGPNEQVKCGTRTGDPGRSFSGTLRLRLSDSDVLN